MFKTTVGLILCLLTVLSFGNSFGQEPGRERHDKELLFGISGLDNIRLNSLGGELGLRYFVSSNFAIRPSFSYQQREAIQQSYVHDYSNGITNDKISRIDLMVEHYLEPHDRLSPYWGLGFSIGNSSSDEFRSLPDSLSTGQATGRNSSSDQNSICSIIGTQWQITQAISIGCEYKIQYRHQVAKTETKYHEAEARKSETISKTFTTTSSSLFLTVLF